MNELSLSKVINLLTADAHTAYSVINSSWHTSSLRRKDATALRARLLPSFSGGLYAQSTDMRLLWRSA